MSVSQSAHDGDRLESANVVLPGHARGNLVTRRVDDLRPHPSYVRHGCTVSALKLSILSSLGDLAFREPIVISQEGTIIDGYARCELAQRQGRATVTCVEHDLTEGEALVRLIQSQRPRSGLNAFCRVLLALDLEPSLQAKARSNQQAGGQHKGSSKLTGLHNLDVRSEIAAAAGVSAGNVTKVKQLMKSAPAAVTQALRTGEISIHRAWLWSKERPEKQLELLLLYCGSRGIQRTIRTLISRQQPKSSQPILNLHGLIERLSALGSDELHPIGVSVVCTPGRAIYISEELSRDLGLQGN
jgi:hypothetical protein